LPAGLHIDFSPAIISELKPTATWQQCHPVTATTARQGRQRELPNRGGDSVRRNRDREPKRNEDKVTLNVSAFVAPAAGDTLTF